MAKKEDHHSKIFFAIIAIVIVFAAVTYFLMMQTPSQTRVGEPIKATRVKEASTCHYSTPKDVPRLYGWWRQDNPPSDVLDSSSWGHHGKIVDNPVFYPSRGIQRSGAYLFDGADDLPSGSPDGFSDEEWVPDKGGLLTGIENTELKSYECFMKISPTVQPQRCLRHEFDAWGLGVDSNGIPEFYMADRSIIGKTTARGNNDIRDSQWHHLVGVKRIDSSRNLFLEIWVDGVLANSAQFPVPVDIPASSKLRMAVKVIGYVDEKAIYGEALPSCYIQARAKLRLFCGDGLCGIGEDSSSCPTDCPVCGNNVCDPGEDLNICPQDCTPTSCAPPDPLTYLDLAYWNEFEAGSGDVVYDWSRNNYHGKMRPGTSFGPGKEGRFSLFCDGLVGYVDLKWDRDGDGVIDATPNLDKIHSDDYTISYWMKPTLINPTPYTHNIFSVDRRYAPQGGNVGGYSSNVFKSTRDIELALSQHPIANPQTLDARDKNGNTLTENNWYHIVETHDWDPVANVAVVKFYIDGKLHPIIHTVTGTQKPLDQAPRWLCAANRPTDSTLTFFYGGYIDSLFIYNKVLSETEVSQLYSTLQYC